jgi:hypothetical protein
MIVKYLVKLNGKIISRRTKRKKSRRTKRKKCYVENIIS